MALAAGTRLGRYEIRSSLGVGGMGEVYLAEDKQLLRTVAIKILPADFVSDAQRVRRFAQEARTASGLNHPNIVTIYEIELTGQQPYIVSEYVEGVTLRGYMKHRRIDLEKALDFALQTTSALA